MPYNIANGDVLILFYYESSNTIHLIDTVKCIKTNIFKLLDSVYLTIIQSKLNFNLT